jgi:hypothetical protein
MMKFYAFLLLTFIGLSADAQQPCGTFTKQTIFTNKYCSQANGSFTSNPTWTCTVGNPTCSPSPAGNGTILEINSPHTVTFDCPSAGPLVIDNKVLIDVKAGGSLIFPTTVTAGERVIDIKSGGQLVIAGEVRGESASASDFDPTVIVRSGGTLYLSTGGLLRLGRPAGSAGSLIVEAGGKVFMENSTNIEIYNGIPGPPVAELVLNGALCYINAGGGPTPLVLVENGGSVTGSGSVSGAIRGAGAFNPAAFSFPLPVKLTSFTATTSNGVVNVKWETTHENNNKEFELQRSANGKDWSTLVTIAGKGTTELKSNYAHTDKAPLRGVSLYRLKQIDYDGKNEVSQVVAVKIGENGRFAFDVTPNLVVNNFKVVASEDLRSSEISIFNTVGNRMNVVVNRNGNEANVDVSNLPSGQYIIRIQNGTEALTKRFMINK